MTEAVFSILGWRQTAPGAFAFAYRCSRFGDFEEVITFPRAATPTPAQSALLDLAALAIGVSYYKANASGRIELATAFASAAAHDLARALYSEGLGEFYVRNNLPYPPRLTFDPAAPALGDIAAPVGAPRTPTSAVVAFGGGMDSHVAYSLIERAGVSAELATVALSDKIKRVIEDCTDAPVTFIDRKLDQRLLAANKAGALNGHIPVTALNSLILILHASFTGADWVVFANERSADESTMTVDGHGVNHQFSKTFHAEQLIRAAVHAASPTGPDYFSVLRPVSELWIARELARLPRPLERFRSCNRNFVFSDSPKALAAGRWCGECAKCVFTALIMAPFLKRAQSIALFGADVLDNPANLSLAEELAGFTDAKPWECVGTVDEVSAALSHLLDDAAWRDALIVRTLAPKLRSRSSESAHTAHFNASLSTFGPGFLPPPLHFITAPGKS
jgi:hypothetical protein